MRRLLILGAIGLSLSAPIQAQEASSCEHLYQEALRLYQDAQLSVADQLADSLSRRCTHDRDQMARILFLRALIAARTDSIEAMRRDLEQLFRNDRNHVIKPYDPLLLAIPQRDELYTEYQLLFGSPETGPGELRKDHGRMRVGIMTALVLPQLEIATDRIVLQEDGPFVLEPDQGWTASTLLEYDVLPNWALRISGGIGALGYSARNRSVRYQEKISTFDLTMGIRKSFWLNKPRWVPFLFAGAGLGVLRSATADVERSGDGVRLLGPLSTDRTTEREQLQYRGIAGAGLAYKVGHTVLSLEGRYELGLTDHTLQQAPYTESELLLLYYYVDNDLRFSTISVAFGIQYIIRYHKRNRIHP
jgi:hypothetical protein